MGINLGFESLGIRGDQSKNFSYEDLDALIQFNNAATEVLDLCHELSGVVRTYSQLDAITKTIKKYGVTQSLEALYGENFSGAASMEAEAEEAKKGLGQKLKDIVKKLWEKIKAFFKWVFDRKERAERGLRGLTYKGPFTYQGGMTTLEGGKTHQFDGKVTDEASFKRTLSDMQSAIKNVGSTRKSLEDGLNAVRESSTAEYIKEQEDAIRKAIKDDKDTINIAFSFIAAAKKAAGGKGDKQNEGAADNAQAAGNQQAEQK